MPSLQISTLNQIKTFSVLAVLLIGSFIGQASTRSVQALTTSNNPIDLSIDVDRDGISDELLAAVQQHLDFQDATMKKYQAAIERGENSTQDINAVIENESRQFIARIPGSSKARQLIDEEIQIVDRLRQERSSGSEEDTPKAKALEARIAQISAELNQEPSYLEFRKAEDKVTEEIKRRKSAEWLFSPTGVEADVEAK